MVAPAATAASTAAAPRVGWGGAHTAAAVVVLLFFGILAYFSSFRGVFLFDDNSIILGNPSLRTLWPLSSSMFNAMFAMRPLVGFTLAVNYALGEYHPWGYHAVNLGIHLLAALALFGLIRRTLLAPALRQRFAPAAAGTLALIVSLLWLIHPLNTQAVTYIIQRSETLMGLFFITTLYCSTRGADSHHPRWWSVLAVLAACAGMASKQVMVGAPLLVLLHDRIFLTESFGAALRRRPGLYAGLAGSWVLLAALIFNAPKITSAGFGLQEVTPLQYALTQFGVIVHYLRLSLWPKPLVLDYEWPIAQSAGQIVPPALLIGALLVLTLWQLRRSSGWGFVGAWFFIALAPTSSIMPISDLAFEHRMYVPLAAVVCGVCLLVYCLGEKIIARTGWQRLPLAAVPAVAGCAFIFSSLTADRNRDYRSAEHMWRDTLAKAPHSFRARIFLGCELVETNRDQEALIHFEAALKLRPDSPVALVNTANVLRGKRQFQQALEYYQRALKTDPNVAEAHSNLANTYVDLGQPEAAHRHYLESLRINPDYGPAYYSMGTLLLEQGNLPGAKDALEAAIKLQPRFPGAHYYLGKCLVRLGDKSGAAAAFRRALELQPDMLAAQLELERLGEK